MISLSPRRAVWCILSFTSLLLSPPTHSQSFSRTDSTAIRIIKPVSPADQNFSGDRQYQTTGERLRRPLRVQVLNAKDLPVPNVPVYFELISYPQRAKNFFIEHDVDYTDQNGFAQTSVQLGTKPGEYEFTAKIENGRRANDLVVFKAFARKPNWVFFLIIGLGGGLGLFLYGMNLMSDGMKKTAGDRMRSILSTLTHNRFVAMGVGAFVTMVIQSSSATTVMLVSFVQAKLMTFAQTLGIIMGAHIGTTITAQIVAFKLTDYALMIVAIGMVLAFVAKKQKVKNIGETVFGFGLLFFGMHVMSEAMYPLRTYDPFIETLVSLENPVLGILVGAVFTALIQSSSAFTGILIVLAAQGVLTLEAGIPLVFGANIGTCITAGLAAINARREAKRVAIAHTLFQVFGVAVFVWWIPHFAEAIKWISPKGPAGLTGLELTASIVPRQVANAHTLFNLATALLLLPFTGQAARLITRLLPDVIEVTEKPYKTKFIADSVISTPSLALSLAKAEIVHMGEIVKKMIEEIILPFVDGRRDVLAALHDDEEEVDFLENEISNFLTRITRQSIPEDDVDEAFQMMYCVTELEQIADIVSKNLQPRAQQWLAGDYEFSEQGKLEIEQYHLSSVKQISRALTAFRESDLKQAKKMKRKYKKYRSMGESFMRTHFERLRDDIPETMATREFHQELVEQFRRINSHATNIARILLDWASEEQSTHTSQTK